MSLFFDVTAELDPVSGGELSDRAHEPLKLWQWTGKVGFLLKNLTISGSWAVHAKSAQPTNQPYYSNAHWSLFNYYRYCKGIQARWLYLHSRWSRFDNGSLYGYGDRNFEAISVKEYFSSTLDKVKEFNREYTSVKENSRLNQAGLPKVVMKDMHRHTIAGNAKHRHILTRHPAMTAYLRNNKKVLDRS